MKNISKTLDIRLIEKKDKLDVINIMKCLSDFFSPETIEYAEEIINNLWWFVAIEKNVIIWFIVYDIINKTSAKIYRMGVLPEFQNQWIWWNLLEHTEKALIERWIKEVNLLTLDEHPDYPWYKLTRKFYVKHNFVIVDSYVDEDVKILNMNKKLNKHKTNK